MGYPERMLSVNVKLRTICALVLVVFLIPSAHAISATSATVMEESSGRILYEYNGDEVRSIASITKLMTALVAIEENEDLQAVVTITADSCGIEGSSLYLREGEEITLEALLYGLMLRSGNDAAHAIAIYTAGSVDAFAELMNAKAKSLNMTSSHFMNPNGLEEEGHYSTANDMARLGCACLQNEILAEIVSTKTISFGDRIFQNHNKLLWQYEGCVGMKTGFTEMAGRTLVSAATRDGMSLVAVTLNAPDDWQDHTALLNDGFASYQLTTVIEGNTKVAQIPTVGTLYPFVTVVTGETISYPTQNGETLSYSLTLPCQQLDYGVSSGDIAGEILYYLDGVQIGSAPVYYAQSVELIAVEPETIWQKIGHLFGK